MVRTVFFGARGVEFSGRHFARICKSDAEVAAVVDSPPGSVDSTNIRKADRSIDEASRRLGVPLFRPASPGNPDFIEEISGLQPDLIVSAGYWGILPKRLLEIPKMASVNFHASLLPRHCGKHPVFWALWYGDTETGITLHHMNEGIDTGDIVYVKRVRVLPRDRVPTLYNRIMNASMPLVDRLFRDTAEGRVPRKPQSSKGYSYNFDLTGKDLRLDFEVPASLLDKRVKISAKRLYFEYEGKKWEVMKCRAKAYSDPAGRPGDMRLTGNSLELITSEGSLVIEAVFDGMSVLKPSRIKNL